MKKKPLTIEQQLRLAMQSSGKIMRAREAAHASLIIEGEELDNPHREGDIGPHGIQPEPTS